MATQQMSSYCIHVRTTDGKGNKSVSEHLVWSGSKFMDARAAEVRKARSENIDSKAAVELIDKKTYEAERAK